MSRLFSLQRSQNKILGPAARALAILCFGVFLLTVPGPGSAPAAVPWQPVDLVLDVKSKFSDGCLSVQNLAELASHRGIGGLLIADHDRISLEYGIRPFERIFKKKEESPSVLASSAATYLSEIRQVDEEFPDVLVLPGVETAPFYYWTGDLSGGALTAHNWDKHLLIAGLNAPEDIEQLPTLNSNFSMRYADRYKGKFLAFASAGIVALVFFYRRKYPKTSLLVAALSFLLAANYHPLRSSPFDQYNGNPGAAPYQETINYVNGQGGLVFWNHLESLKANRDRPMGDMQMQTALHPEDLMLTQNYSGFQALDDDRVPAVDPGNEWDQVLRQHLKKERRAPVWGFGANDFHCEDQDGHRLGSVRTVVWVKQKDAVSVLDAMKKGRMYAVTQPSEKSRLSLDRFIVADRSRGLEATLGESLVSSDIPEISLAFGSTGGKETSIELKVIRDGKVVKQETVSLPYQGTWRDMEVNPVKPVYYRIMAEADNGSRLVSNPIFVRFGEVPEAVASLTDSQPASPAPPQAPVAPADPGAATPSTPKLPSQTSPVPPVTTQAETPDVPAPKGPAVAEVAEVKEPEVTAPEAPSLSTGRTVVSKINGLSLKKGPGASFPEIMQASKGESLELVRETTVMLSGKPWVVVKKDGRQAYAWMGFLNTP